MRKCTFYSYLIQNLYKLCWIRQCSLWLFPSSNWKAQNFDQLVNEAKTVLNNSLLQWINETVAHGFCVSLLISWLNFYLAVRNWIMLYERNTINVHEHNLIQVLLQKGKTSTGMCSREWRHHVFTRHLNVGFFIKGKVINNNDCNNES